MYKGMTLAPLSNYYGTIHVLKEDEKYFLGLENYDGNNTIEISKRLYDAFINESKKNQEWKEYNDYWHKVGE